jgi:hypothetical protein
MSAPTVTAALTQLEATEANLAKLERLCGEIYKPIASGIRFGSNPDYEDRCRLVTEILKQLPKTYGPPRLQEFLRSCPFQSAVTYPASRHGQEPRWRSAQPSPHNRTDLIGHFGNQVSRLPFDC